MGLDYKKEESKNEIERLAFKVVKSDENNYVNIEHEKEIEIEINGKTEKKKIFTPFKFLLLSLKNGSQCWKLFR